ncbi:MAG TPA: alpha-L-rhamnosidase C-terminal domain-containing protein [Kiritimatiellia bacterium]|nr:alpha-L-rhamnosidase C-terminal domain-containing protein [Kiritimatiellia bacterium]
MPTKFQLDAANPEAFQAPWMWVADEPKARNAYGLFRFSLKVDRPEVLRLRLTADCWYSFFKNGSYVQRGPVRGFSDCYPFDEIVVPLMPGRHVLALLVHHVGDICATYKIGRPGVRVDGAIGGKPLGEFGNWRCCPASSWKQDLPERMSHFGFWEDRDLRGPEAAWAQPDFDDRGWGEPFRIPDEDAALWKSLVARDIPPFRCADVPATRCAQGLWEGDEITERPSLTHVKRMRSARANDLDLSTAPRRYETFDFHRTINGYLRVKIVCAEPDTELIVGYDEFLQPSGAVDAERSYARFADRFVLPQGETVVEGVQPRGYRYATLDADKPACIEAVWVTEERYAYDDARRDVFTSSNPDHAPMYSKDLLTADLCTLDTFVDCPNRERVHFMEAVHPAARSALFGFGDAAIVRRSLRMGAQSQLPDGSINGFSPSDRTNLAFATSSLLWLHTLLDDRECTGDEDFLLTMAEPVKRLLQKFTSCQDERLLIRWDSWWDWSPCELQGTLFLTNAFWLSAVERMARVPILAELAAEHVKSIARLRQSIHETFWNPERGLYRTAIRMDGTPSPLANQFGNAMAVLAGICPPERRRELLQRITRPGNLYFQPVGDCNHAVEQIMPDDQHLIIPFGMHYPASFLVEAMFQNGMDVEAHRLMDQYWGPYLKEPVFPEVFVPGKNSFLCHDWGCGSAYLLQAYVAGLRPAAPGWREILWEPHPGPLTHCRTEAPTPHGIIRAEYRREGERLHLRAEIPDGCRLRVRAGGRDEMVSAQTEWQGVR